MRMKNVRLDIEPGLWKEFKAACAHYDISMAATLINHIKNIVNDYRLYKKGFTGKDSFKLRKKQ